MIEDVRVDPIPRRPWWFVPGLLAVGIGGIVGFFLLPAPPPPCSPMGASSEIVVRRFFERIGGPPSAIEECWARGWLTPQGLEGYSAARPPDDISLDRVTEGSLGIGDKPEGRRHVTWEITIGGRSSPLWQCPSPSKFALVLREDDDERRWLIEATSCVMPATR